MNPRFRFRGRVGMAVLAGAALFACTDTSQAPTALQAPTGAHRSISPGDNLRQITGAYSQGNCSINTGIAFDGTNLILSCWSYPVLDIVSPTDGHLISSVTIPGYNGFGALAYDAVQHKLWACDAGNDNGVVLVDLATATGVTKFSSAGCIDGLAYDGSDQTIWASPDVSSTVYHYQQDGTLISSFPVGGLLGGYGNSGIAVGGQKLYLANDGGSTIYEAAKDFSSVTMFASFPRRLEDMECDDVTFAFDGVGAIWSIDAYDRILNAWAIPAGACKFGGGGPPPCTTPPTTTLAALPGTLWPPNHKYVPITVTSSATPGCANDVIASTSGFVVSSEPDEEVPVGDGHTSGDIKVTHMDGTVTLSSNAAPSVPFDPAKDHLELRAERQGTSTGRTYTLSFTATGGSGLTSTSTATVVVNHNP